MCLAQGPQHSDAGEARTCSPSVSSQAFYHCATALPVAILLSGNQGSKSNILKNCHNADNTISSFVHWWTVFIFSSIIAYDVLNEGFR